MKEKSLAADLEGERLAFDSQIAERVKHGHVPDLRWGKRNEWFYNNVWRDPAYVKMSFLENVAFLEKYLPKEAKILEIGCGPGHISLELARGGHRVTALDLSPECIEVAKKTFKNNKHLAGFGSLRYQAGDFLSTSINEKNFDAVLFFGSLSHFPDLGKALDRANGLLATSGQILVWDTGIDLYTKQDAVIFYLIRALLAFASHYYRSENLPANEKELKQKVVNALKELQYLDEKGDNVQSPHDNAFTYQTMMAALDNRFKKLVLVPESCFYRNMIGGIRFKRPEDEHAMAAFIKLIDNYLIKNGMLSPAFFYYIGQKRKN